MKIFDINLKPVVEDTYIIIDKLINSDKASLIFTPNPEILLEASHDEKFKKNLQEADILFPDWIWLYLAYQILDNKYNRFLNTLFLPYFLLNLVFNKKWLYKKYWSKICWSDFTYECIEYAEENKLWVFILDLHNPTDSKKVESQKNLLPILRKKYPNIKWFLEIYEEEKHSEVVNNIEKSEASFCFATLGVKKQEELLVRLKPHMNNIKIWAWIWSSIDYLIWYQFRAPSWMQKAWLEWLYRLYTSPDKLRQLKKIYRALVLFPLTVIKNKR